MKGDRHHTAYTDKQRYRIPKNYDSDRIPPFPRSPVYP